jgi:hypothetical protein
MAKTLKDFKTAHDPTTIIADLQAQLKEAKSRADTADLVREWIGSAQEALTQVEPPKWLSEPKKVGAPGVPTIQLSDFHWGEVVKPEQIGGVNQFNLKIARQRLEHVIQGAIKISRILSPEMAYPGIVAPLLGDMISGNIHDELSATNELNTMPTVLDLFRHLVASITLLADTFGRVFLPCVGGNHGRDTKKTWAKDRNHTSFDWLLYQFLAVRFADDNRVTFYIPDGSDVLYRVYGLRYLGTHGDQFKSGDSIIGPIGPITRGAQKKLARNAAVDQAFDVMIFGHWHQRMLSSQLRGNGTLKGLDEYAYQGNFRFEPPSQNFWVTHPDHGITFDAPLFTDSTTKASKTPWTSWS